MEIKLTPNQEAFIQQGIARGDYKCAEEALGEALSLWAQRQRRLAELRVALDEAEDDVASGRYREYENETLPRLAGELKREARESRR